MKLPHLNPALVKGIVSAVLSRAWWISINFSAKRSMANNLPNFIQDVYPINLNTATREEIMLIPGMGNRMVREFFEYRPYTALTLSFAKRSASMSTIRKWPGWNSSLCANQLKYGFGRNPIKHSWRHPTITSCAQKSRAPIRTWNNSVAKSPSP